jgi:transposase InsO family protein
MILASIARQAIAKQSAERGGMSTLTEDLKEIGLEIGHWRVGRLMRQSGELPIRTPKHKVTTDSNHSFPRAAQGLLHHTDRGSQ